MYRYLSVLSTLVVLISCISVPMNPVATITIKYQLIYLVNSEALLRPLLHLHQRKTEHLRLALPALDLSYLTTQ